MKELDRSLYEEPLPGPSLGSTSDFLTRRQHHVSENWMLETSLT
jgi:hypothetical protein